jgi:sulfur-oxidizing protein SoxY
MKLNRREVLGFGAAAVVVATLPTTIGPAIAADETADDAIKAFTGGAPVGEGSVKLTTPEIAENGNTVPVSVKVDSPMTADNYVQEVMLIASGNPNPGVATFKFSTMSGEASASTRIRLAKTQDIIAVAKMSDGSFQMAKNAVKVTIGGCGG